MASVPSESTAFTSLRTSAPPSEMECVEKLALRPKLAVESGHVEGVARSSLLNLVMVHHRAFAGHDLGYGVGEVAARSRVSLDDGALRVGAHQDQVRGWQP